VTYLSRCDRPSGGYSTFCYQVSVLNTTACQINSFFLASPCGQSALANSTPAAIWTSSDLTTGAEGWLWNIPLLPGTNHTFCMDVPEWQFIIPIPWTAYGRIGFNSTNTIMGPFCLNNYCALSPCSNGGTCTNLATTRECTCLPGTFGTSCEKSNIF